MGSYETEIDVLEHELQGVLAVFDELSADDWKRSTKLVPLDTDARHWTVFELAGHFDISIGLTSMLIDSPSDEQVGRDRVSFFIVPTVGSGARRLLVRLHDGRGEDPGGDAGCTPRDLHEGGRRVASEPANARRFRVLRPDGARRVRTEPDRRGGRPRVRPHRRARTRDDRDPGWGRVHGGVMDELLRRRTVGGRPSDLSDDLAWVRAASGRAPHHDPRLPLIG
jgi:hypothetical protein